MKTYLPEEFLQWSRIQLGFVYYFNSHFFAGWYMLCQFHFGKIAFADCL